MLTHLCTRNDPRNCGEVPFHRRLIEVRQRLNVFEFAVLAHCIEERQGVPNARGLEVQRLPYAGTAIVTIRFSATEDIVTPAYSIFVQQVCEIGLGEV